MVSPRKLSLSANVYCWQQNLNKCIQTYQHGHRAARCVTLNGLKGVIYYGSSICPSYFGFVRARMPRLKSRHRKWRDRKSTRLNSSHVANSYAVLCLKKKITHLYETTTSAISQAH